MKPAYNNPYKMKESIGFSLIILGTVGMFLGGILTLYNTIFKLLACAGVGLMAVGILMAVINYFANKINNFKNKNHNSSSKSED